MTGRVRPAWVSELLEKLEKTVEGLDKAGVAEWIELYRDPRRLLVLNFFSGMRREPALGAEAGGDEPVAVLDLLVALDQAEVELAGSADDGLDQALGAAADDAERDRVAAVGDQRHQRGASGDVGDMTDQAVLGDDHVVDRDAVAELPALILIVEYQTLGERKITVASTPV